MFVNLFYSCFCLIFKYSSCSFFHSSLSKVKYIFSSISFISIFINSFLYLLNILYVSNSQILHFFKTFFIFYHPFYIFITLLLYVDNRKIIPIIPLFISTFFYHPHTASTYSFIFHLLWNVFVTDFVETVSITS